MRIVNTSSIALVLGLLCAAPLVAQESSGAVDGRVLTLAAMDDALTGHESRVDQQRAELAQLLSQPQVQELARDRGINLGQVESAAASLSDQQMEQLAPLVAKVSPFMQNGLGTITISVAAVIIILLVLILVS